MIDLRGMGGCGIEIKKRGSPRRMLRMIGIKRRNVTQCQQNKVNTHPRKAPLNPITPTTGALPFQTIAMDFIVKLPESAGHDSILTITDHDCTKMLIAIPCRETITAEGVAKLFLQLVFPRFGLPSKIISDRDPRFVSKFMRELC